MVEKEKAKRTDYKDILDALKLTPDDVEANRQGKLTAAQINRLKAAEEDAGCVALAIPFLLMGAFACVASCVAYLSTIRADTSGMGSPGRWVLLLSVIAAVMLGMFALQIHRLRRDLAEQKIESATGPLHADRHRGKENIHYSFSIGTAAQDISEDVYYLLKTREGEWFTVYYLPNSKTFLSLEPERKTKVDETTP